MLKSLIEIFLLDFEMGKWRKSVGARRVGIDELYKGAIKKLSNTSEGEGVKEYFTKTC